MKKLVTLMLVFGALAFFTACGDTAPRPDSGNSEENTGGSGGGNDGGNDGGDGGGDQAVGKSGFVTFVETEEGGSPFIFGSGSFFEVDDATAVPTDGDLYGDLEDTCFFGDETPGDVANPVDPGGEEAVYLDAGEALTVNSGGAVYATLERSEQGDVVVYQTNLYTPIQESVPEDATITVPGSDAFPSFSDKALPAIPDFALTAPADPQNATVTGDSSFAWTGSAEDSVVVLAFGNQDVNLSCLAQDDGAFTFPEATKQELSSRGFSGGIILASRSGYRVHQQGDASLVLFTSQSETYGGVGTADVKPAALLERALRASR